MIAIEMGNTENWDDLAERHDCTVDEVKNVSPLLVMRGSGGQYEDEIEQLNRRPYSNEINQWFDEKFRAILVEIRAM